MNSLTAPSPKRWMPSLTPPTAACSVVAGWMVALTDEDARPFCRMAAIRLVFFSEEQRDRFLAPRVLPAIVANSHLSKGGAAA